MKHSFFIIILSFISTTLLGQVEENDDIFTSLYITEFKDKIDSIINAGQADINHDDGEMWSGTSYYYNKKLVKKSFHDFDSNGSLETVIYCNIDNEDCVADIKYYEDGVIKLSMRLVKLKEFLYEKVFKGNKDIITSEIEKIRKTIINAP